jgi:hypothetical protein
VHSVPAAAEPRIFPPPGTPRGAQDPSAGAQPLDEGLPTPSHDMATGAVAMKVLVPQSLLVVGAGAGKRRGTAGRHFEHCRLRLATLNCLT